MNNKITILISEILAMADNSITDIEIIRQIGLVTTDFNMNITMDERKQLGNKIKKEFHYAALYPHVMNTLTITDSVMLSELEKQRRIYKQSQRK